MTEHENAVQTGDQDGAEGVTGLHKSTLDRQQTLRFEVEKLFMASGGAPLAFVSWRSNYNDPRFDVEAFTFPNAKKALPTLERWATEPERNVYVRLCTLKDGVTDANRVGEGQVDKALCLVLDFDAKHGHRLNIDALPFPPTEVVVTSRLPAPSYQVRYWYAAPVETARHREIAEWFKTRLGLSDKEFDDSGTGTPNHLWRVLGSLNWPNKGKIDAGRPRDGQEVLCLDGWTYADARRFNAAPCEVVVTEEPERGKKTVWPRKWIADKIAGKRLTAQVARRVDEALNWDGAISDDLSDLTPELEMMVRECRRAEDEGKVDRSAVMVSFALGAILRGLPTGRILGIMNNPAFKIYDHPRGQKKPVYAVLRGFVAGAVIAGEADDDFQVHPMFKFIMGNYHNCKLAIRKLGLIVEYNEFTGVSSLGGHPLINDGEVTDRATGILREMINREFRFDPSKEGLNDAVLNLGYENPSNPVVEYLDHLEWDGIPRVDSWLHAYCRAEENELHKWFGRLVLVAAVRRARQPGCKYDTALVLEGTQGTGKSTAVRILGGEYFSDERLLDADDKARREALRGVWFYELAELEGISRADARKVKAFLSKTEDRGRAAFGRHTQSWRRTCVFIGTTNDEKYLMDDTGNRRFWPVRVGEIDLEGLRRDRDQLFAEAAVLERTTHDLTLPRGLWERAAQVQAEREEPDPWEEILIDRLTEPQTAVELQPGGDGGRVKKIATREVLRLLGFANEDIKNFSHVHGRRVIRTMRRLGWNGPKEIKMGGVSRKGYTINVR